MKYRLLASLGFVLAIFSCSKEEYSLPAMTREGRNTMGFVTTDGRIFAEPLNDDDKVSKDSFGGLTIKYQVKTRKWHFDYLYLLEMELLADTAAGSFLLSTATFRDEEYTGSLDPSMLNYFEVSYHDPAKCILSGNFELHFLQCDTIYTGDSLNTVHHVDTIYTNTLSDGRFDLRYSN